MNLPLLVAQLYLPNKLVAPLISYTETRIGYKRLEKRNFRRHILFAAVHIVRFYKMKETAQLKALVNMLVDALTDLFEYYARDVRVAKLFRLSDPQRNISLYEEDDAEPPP